jgi:hypothetical protein
MQRSATQKQDDHRKPGQHALTEGNSNHEINFSENSSVDRNNLNIASARQDSIQYKFNKNQHLESHVAIMRHSLAVLTECTHPIQKKHVAKSRQMR